MSTTPALAQTPVAVVVPLHTRPALTASEQLSLRHLDHHLGSYDRFLLVPEGHPATRPGYRVVQFGRQYFGSARAYARLMLSRQFYERFRHYTFILIYHPDALVFSDRLGEWCAAGYDYIGAPWLRQPDAPEQGFSHVGNGGFSLRRVAACLRVLSSPAYNIPPVEYDRRWQRVFGGRAWPQRLLHTPRKWLKRIQPLNSVRQAIADYRLNEDHFWAEEAVRFDPTFRVAPPEVAVRFAFEAAPRYCMQQTGGALPFGCHAWESFDPDFWKPYLLEHAAAPAPHARAGGLVL